MRRLLCLWVVGLVGCAESSEMGDHPVTRGHARKATDPEFAAKRAKHIAGTPPHDGAEVSQR